jgi:hypothetical protein
MFWAAALAAELVVVMFEGMRCGRCLEEERWGVGKRRDGIGYGSSLLVLVSERDAFRIQVSPMM